MLLLVLAVPSLIVSHDQLRSIVHPPPQKSPRHGLPLHRHFAMPLPWIQAVRIVQAIFGLIVLALTAYGVSFLHTPISKAC